MNNYLWNIVINITLARIEMEQNETQLYAEMRTIVS